MNQTGLSQSLHPNLSSRLLSSPSEEPESFRFCSNFNPNRTFFNDYKLPFLIEAIPLKLKTTREKPPNGKTIPRCKKCSGFPNKYVDITSISWVCPVCNNENPLIPSYWFPKSGSYEVLTQKLPQKPLFLFIIQSSSFFTNEESKTLIGKALDHWAHSVDTNVSCIGIGEHITILDLDKPSAQVFIDSDDYKLKISSSKNAHFESCIKSIPTSKTLPPVIDTVFKILSNIKYNNVCVCLFANEIEEIQELNEEFSELLKMNRFGIYLFTSIKPNCRPFIKHCQKIKIFENDQIHLVAPQLYKFLNSGFLFNAKIGFYYDPSVYNPKQLICRKIVTGTTIVLPCIDGQTSATLEIQMPIYQSSKLQSLFYQVEVDGITPDGYRIIKCSTRSLRMSSSIEKFDGILYGCYYARCAAFEAYFESPEDSFRNLRSLTMRLITAWSAEGHYKRSIPTIFRDIPLLMFATENCDVYKSEATPIQKLAVMINFLSLPSEELRRTLYPLLLIPPLTFPHRLTQTSFGQFKLFIFIRAYDGIAVNLTGENKDDEIDQVSQSFDVPIIVYTDMNHAIKLLVEEKNATFSTYAEKLEVEINGRRFQ